MNIFYLRNLNSVRIAERIISQEKITDTVALIHNPGTNHYLGRADISEHLISILNKNIWSKVMIDYDPGFQRIEGSYYKFKILRPFERRVKNRKYFVQKKTYYENLLKSLNIKNIFLCFHHSLYDERLLYIIAKKINITLNRFEEGPYSADINPELFRPLLKRLKIAMKHSLDVFLDMLFLNDILENTLFLGEKSKNYSFDWIFTSFPELYNQSVKEKIIEIRPFNTIINTNQIKSISCEVLFLSRPVSDFANLVIDDEVDIILSFLEKYDGKVYIKFHPREPLYRIKLLSERLSARPLPDDLKKLPAEDLLELLNPKVIAGWDTSTLFYATKFPGVKVVSLIGSLYDSESISKKKFIEKFYDGITII